MTALRCSLPWLLATSVLALFLAGCSPAAKQEKLVAGADRHFDAHDYDRAEVEYLNLLKADPQSGHAIARLGLIYSAQGRTSRAVAFLMRGLELQPNDLAVRLRVGQLYLVTGKPTEARAEANFILDRQPQDAEAPSLLVATLANPNEAETLRQRLLRLPAPAPDRAPVLTALAALEMRLGRINEAEAMLTRAKAADPTFASLYSLQAALHVSRKNQAGAEEAYREAARLSPPRSPQHLQYAQFKVRSGNLPEGTKLLEEVTTKTPDYLPAWLALAEMSLMQNKLDDCAAQLERVLSRDAQNLEASILKGRLLNLRNQPEQALALLEKLLENYPRVPVVHLELGRTHAASGDLSKAISSLNQALAIAPNLSEATLLLARLHSRKGEHNVAIALLRKLVQQRPDLSPARLQLADAYRSQGSLSEATELYTQLAQQNPGNAQILLLNGLVLAQQAKVPEAREFFERAFKLTPDSPTALEQLVNLGIREKQYAAITQRVEAEVAANPKLAGFGQLLLAKISLAQQNNSAAETHLKQAIELRPDDQNPYFLLAGLYSRTNRQEEALTQLTEVLNRDPKQVTALMLASMLHDQRGNHQAAREGYEKLLALNPRSVVALNNLAYLQAEKLNDLDKALDLAQKARQLAPGDPHNADTLGWILYRRGQYARANALLQEAAEKLPDEPEIRYHQGMAGYMTGDEITARDALQRALQINASAGWAGTARQALAVLELKPETIGPSARPLLEKILAEQPDDPVALIRQAWLLEREGKAPAAIAKLEEVLKTHEQNAMLHRTLARLHSAAKNPARALEYAKSARKLAPDDPAVARSLGKLAFENADYPWAASLLQEAVRRQERADPELLYELALATYSVGQTTETQAALREALALVQEQPLVAFAHASQSRALLDLIGLAQNPAQATEQQARIGQMLENDPNSVPALMAQAAAQEHRGNPDAARSNYEKALALFPDFTPAKLRLVVLGGTQRIFDQQLFDRALQLRPAHPDDPLVAKTLGIQTLLKGDHSRALTLLKECLSNRSQDAVARYYLGLAQHRSKDSTYKKTLQEALDAGLAEASLVTEARRLLKE